MQWASKTIKQSWKIIYTQWDGRNQRLHDPPTLNKLEGVEILHQAMREELHLGLNQLPLQEFTHIFKHPIETLMKKLLESKKSWFATIRAGRIVYDDTILQDKFATQGPLQKWVGISSIAFKTRTTIYRTFTRSNNIRMGEGNRNDMRNYFEEP